MEGGVTKRAFVSEPELMRFVSFYAERKYWPRADRRTIEGRAQEIALARGWLDPLPLGCGYRVSAEMASAAAPEAAAAD